jgi:hypothetical protein
MPLYCFALHNGRRFDDPESVEFLPHDEAAHKAALRIVRDLKKNSGTRWNGWTIEVTEDARPVWRIPFIGADA